MEFIFYHVHFDTIDHFNLVFTLVQRVHSPLSGRKTMDDHVVCNRDRVVSILISPLYEFCGVSLIPIHFG